jgi:hypothetical protein
MENRNGLLVDFRIAAATGTTERELGITPHVAARRSTRDARLVLHRPTVPVSSSSARVTSGRRFAASGIRGGYGLPCPE